jgi:two-component system LytT family response regulator
MTAPSLRIVVADDERPARAFLLSRLRALPEVTVVGEASSGAEAVQLIERLQPDVALLDLQMPEVDGLGVVRLVRRRFLPLVIFVTAFDEYAVRAFDVNAVDYLTKPVGAARLREALRRAQDRLERTELRTAAAARLKDAMGAYERTAPPPRPQRIPVRVKDDIVLLPVSQISSVVADGELLHLVTSKQEHFTLTYRLKDLEARLDPDRFIRLGRGALANIDHITRVTPLPGGTYTIRLQNGQELDVSRIQSRMLRGRLLQL